MGQPGIFSQLATVDGIRTVEGIRGEWKRWGWGGARQKSEDDEVEYYNSDSHSVPGFYFQERILRIGNLFDLTEAKGLQGTCTTNFLPLTPFFSISNTFCAASTPPSTISIRGAGTTVPSCIAFSNHSLKNHRPSSS